MKRKTALITGASRGIGNAIAEKLAYNGYDLVLNCKNNIDSLSKTAEDLKERYHIQVLTIQGDVGNYDFVCEMFNEINNFCDGLDVLVNNAGIAHIGMLQDTTIDEWNALINTNLSSVFACSKLAIPGMLKIGGGNVVNISSIWGLYGASCEVAYSATKGGIDSFTKALAKELAPSNIKVNAVACGVIDTDMNKCVDEESMAELIESIPAGRLGTPSEVADMVYQIICSPLYLTGQVIQFDGGFI